MNSSSGASRPRNFIGRGPSRSGRNLAARLPRLARLAESETLTPTGTVRLHFEVVDEQPFDFVPGQFVAVDMNHHDHGYRRSPYCLMDGSEEGRWFELLIRRVSEGPVSLFLADLAPGDVISFRGPNGHSMLPTEDDTELVLIATGVGLSPCYCLVRRLQIMGVQRRTRLFWGLRLQSDICLLAELDSLLGASPDFEYAVSLSNATGQWQGLRGRVTESVPPLLETLSDKHFYLVSNGEMVAEMSLVLQNLGVSRDRIYEESFFNHRHQPDPEVICHIEDRFVATDIERPIERLQRELSQFGSSWPEPG